MSVKPVKLMELLGKPALGVVGAEPFRGRNSVREVELESDPPAVNYSFKWLGVELACDVGQEECVHSAFVQADGRGAPLLCGEIVRLRPRDLLLELGEPSARGGETRHPVLGAYGPWFRFDLGVGCLHVHFSVGGTRVQLVTAMRQDAVPK